MILKYNLEITNENIILTFNRLIDQIYKLLPNREEGVDWEKPLETIMEELSGISRLLVGQQINLFPLMSKLEGLFTLTKEEDFYLYRRIIFECLNLLTGIIKLCQD